MKPETVRHTFKHACLGVLSGVVLLVAGCATWKTSTIVLCNGTAGETALLRIPFNVDIRSLDDRPVCKTFGQDEAVIKIEPGSHKAEVRYSVLQPASGNDFEKIQSDYFVISFDCLGGGTYRIECQDPNTLEGARRFARAPVFAVLPRVSAVKPVPTPPAAAPTAAVAPAIPAPKPRITPNTDRSSELMRVWEKATPEERKVFLESMSAPRSETTDPVPAP